MMKIILKVHSNRCINTFPYYRSTFKSRTLLSYSWWSRGN